MPGSQLAAVQHIVHLMLENRSFDHMLGLLYAGSGNVSPAGDPYEGLTGTESCPGPGGDPVPAFRIDPAAPGAYYMPGGDPGEGYQNTNEQLFGSPVAPVPPVASNDGFVTNFAAAIAADRRAGLSVAAGTTAESVMGGFGPEALPVLSGLARGFAVCDHWFGSAPTETFPNRAFACAATSQGRVSDSTVPYTAPTIFGLLSARQVSWMLYGYDTPPLTRLFFGETTAAQDAHFGQFADFKAAAAHGTLPAYCFLEPAFGSGGNSQHPNYDVALGEQFILEVYRAVRAGPGWDASLLIVTYDEHGGCYDHVPPPSGVAPPDASGPGELGFDFTRLGPRVPTVLVSPLIPEGTVFRVPAGAAPLDHTSVLATIEARWGLPALTGRDAAAAGLGGVLSLAGPRGDDPLAGVSAPVATGAAPAAGEVSHIERLHAELAGRRRPPVR